MLIPFVSALIGLLLCLTIVRQLRGRARVRRSLEASGYRVYRMESRFFTRGPFHEMLHLPGTKRGDVLFRVLALDQSGSSHVLWARLHRGAPWQELRFELRQDHAPDTKSGLSAALFYGLIFAVGLALLLVGAFRAMPAVPIGSRTSLTGTWSESGWRLCTSVARLSADQIDHPVQELWFGGDGRFSVTWRPFEGYRDYWGSYRYDAASHAIELEIERGNFVPRDFVGRGTAVVEGDHLTLSGVRLGTREATNRAAVCELTFTRRSASPSVPL